MSEKKQHAVHKILNRILQELLTPLGVMVQTDASVMTDSPEADIILLRSQTLRWTPAQRRVLPDGIRDTTAEYILIDFKYTESLNRRVLLQASAYRYFLMEKRNLKPEQVHTVIISSKTPQRSFLEEFGFYELAPSGVWHCRSRALDFLEVLVLNDLSFEPHNLFVKLFASRRKVRKRAFQELLKSKVRLTDLGYALYHIIIGLFKIISHPKGDSIMKDLDLTPEFIMEFGEDLKQSFLASIPLEDRLRGLQPEDILRGLQRKSA